MYWVWPYPPLCTHSSRSRREIGRVIGGTKGNKILDFVSGSPNKPFLIEEASNVFDYDELTKYGYSVSEPSFRYLDINSILYIFIHVLAC